MTVAQAEQDGRGVIAEAVGEEHEHQVGHARDDNALAGIHHQLALTQRLGALQTGSHQPHRKQQEPSARASGDAHHLLAVDGQVVAHHAEAEPEEHHVHGQQPASDEEEAVQRHPLHALSLRPWLLMLRLLRPDTCIHHQAQPCYQQGQPEQQLKVVRRLVEVDGHGRRNGHGQVVAEAVVANTFVASRRGHDVNGHRGIGHRQRAEGGTVQRPHDREQQERRSAQVATEEDEEQREAHHQHTLARERVDQEAAERARQQSRQRVAAQHQAHHVLCRLETLHQIERQQRRQQVEGEEQREVRRHHPTIVPVPQAFARRHRRHQYL